MSIENGLILEIDDLRIDFVDGKIESKAVQGLSLTMNRGEILGVVGESGSGKTVTGLSLLDLLDKKARISGGSITYHSLNGPIQFSSLGNKRIQELRGREIGMVFQEPMTALNPSYTCGNQIMEVLTSSQSKTSLDTEKTKAEKKEIILRHLRAVELKDVDRVFTSYPHELSGGQKQRVMIAMSLAAEVSLLIADEITTALDASVKRSILALLKKLVLDHNLSVLFISHDIDAVAFVADRIIVMRNGQHIEVNNTSSLLSSPKENYTKGLLACKPPLHKDVAVLPTLDNLHPASIENSVPKVDPNEILSGRGISVLYGGKKSLFGKSSEKKALIDVDFQLYTGQCLGIIGESGSGKSTLASAIMKSVGLNKGQLLFEGEDISSFKGRRLKLYRQQVQIVYQDPYSTLNPSQRVGKAIQEVMAIHGERSRRTGKELVVDLLESVELKADDYEKFPHQFSGGQRQRISIARALSVAPKLLICDECTSALDVSIQAELLNLLKQIQSNRELSMLFISHDIAVTRFISDSILVLKSGRVMEQQEAGQLIDQPQSDYTRSLIEQSQ